MTGGNGFATWGVATGANAEKATDGSPDQTAVVDRTPYLYFGGDEEYVYTTALNCSDSASYLRESGFDHGGLTLTRAGVADSGRYTKFRGSNEHYCDFCGRTLTGVEYERLADGRERCVYCARSALHGRGEYEALFDSVRGGLCEKFGISIDTKVSVRVTSAAKIARLLGKGAFTPTSGFDPRAIGLAVRQRKGNYHLYLENGAPRTRLTSTIAHELTHIWQYANWDWEALKKKYGKAFDAVVEGMAEWTEIQYLFLINETESADRDLRTEMSRNDEYGVGLREYMKRYSMARGTTPRPDTPFMHPDDPFGQ